MSLHGTLETFALPDVLTLLSATKKSGELRVVGGRVDGRLWLDGGEIVGAEVGHAASFVDAVFELLRLISGKFSFDAEKAAPAPTVPVAIEPLLAEAQARLVEWRSIEAVVPSLQCGVGLVPDVRDPHVTVTTEQWRALVAVAQSRDVHGVMGQLSLGEFDACRLVKGLVEAGLVDVSVAEAPAAAPSPAPIADIAPQPVPAPAAEVSVEPEPQPEVVAMAEAVTAVEDATTPAEPEPTPEPVLEPDPVVVEPAAIQAVAPAGAIPAGGTKIAPLVSSPTGDDVEAPAPAKAKPAKADAQPGAEPAAVAETDEAAAEADALVHQLAVLTEAVPDTEPAAAPEVEAQPEPAIASDEPAVAASSSDGAAAAPAPGGTGGTEEPINRGLLLKFLSSVRN